MDEEMAGGGGTKFYMAPVLADELKLGFNWFNTFYY